MTTKKPDGKIVRGAPLTFEAALKAESESMEADSGHLTIGEARYLARWGRSQTLAEVKKLIDKTRKVIKASSKDTHDIAVQKFAVGLILSDFKRKLKEMESRPAISGPETEG